VSVLGRLLGLFRRRPAPPVPTKIEPMHWVPAGRRAAACGGKGRWTSEGQWSTCGPCRHAWSLARVRRITNSR
jgi:hypothetical protein